MTDKFKLNLVCNSSSICEIGPDDANWKGDGVVSVTDEEIAEITSGDASPFFVEFVAVYEGLSGNGRLYTKEAVESCIDAMIGVNMYKGHVEPGTQGWKYREPVGRVIAAKLSKIDDGDRKGVLCAKGKAYITEADLKLRSDLRKKMAGNVSILGDGRSVYAQGESVKKVIKIHKPLRSVDFCNPGTAGMPLAGVTQIVSEMSETPTNDKKEEVKMAKLTREELLTEYKTEISALVGEQIEEQIAEIAKGRREVAEERENHKTKEKEFNDKLSEMQAQQDALKAENDKLKSQIEQEKTARLKSELKVYADGYIAEISALDGSNPDIIKMAADEIVLDVVDGDLEKSKEAYRGNVKKSVEKLVKISEMFGGGSGGGNGKNKETTQKKSHQGNPGKKDSDGPSKFMSSELAESYNKRVGSAS